MKRRSPQSPSLSLSLLAALACVAAAGCANRATAPATADVMQVASAPLVCADSAQCATWWQRAQDWVRDHSSYEVQTSTDTLIKTSGPGAGRRALAYRITKTVNDDGSATIDFAAHCDSAIGCKPDPWRAGADFKQYVRSGAPAATGSAPAAASGTATQ